jgi:hypothetical protein
MQSPNIQSGVISHSPGTIGIVTEPVSSSVPYNNNIYQSQSGIVTHSTISPTGDLPHNNSGITSTDSSGGGTRQVSPNTLFGGVEALVESQDWWLKDQASLVLGFDNWMGSGNSAEGLNPSSGNNTANAQSPELNHTSVVGSGYYAGMPSSGNHANEMFGEDDWNYP